MPGILFLFVAGALFLLTCFPSFAQQPPSRFETFDRYDPTQYAVEVEGVPGEHIDMRTLGVSWEVTDYVIPGNGGLDIELTRSFNRVFHTPSDMGHWYFGVPRIQIPTSPWRLPYDPSFHGVGTFDAAWNNLRARLSNGGASICERAGLLIDQEFRGSVSGSLMGGIMFAAPIFLYVPGEGPKVLLERRTDQNQFPASATYVTTDNWWATCLPPTSDRIWGGFTVYSPDGRRFVFDFIQYLVPGDYATGSTGGWVEMGISGVYDNYGNSIEYQYDTGTGGTGLLTAIEASDGRRVTLDYYPGSRRGVDVQGSPLALISSVNVHADGQVYAIDYEYCDFADFYLLQTGCEPIDLGVNKDLPVLHVVRMPHGPRTEYRYHPSMYSANVLLDWGNFEFQLWAVKLPTGGIIDYSYAPGFHAVLQSSDSPAPRLSRRRTSGRGISTGIWNYEYSYADHEETVVVEGPDREEVYTFYEGLGTYEFRIARYPGQHSWPDTAPTDYDEELGLLRRSVVNNPDGSGPLRETRFEYARQGFIGKQSYSGNWLGWPTLVLAQIRQRPISEKRIIDYATAAQPVEYVTRTDPSEFDVYGFPAAVLQTGVDPLASDGLLERRTEYTWHHDADAGYIGLPDRQTVDGYTIDHDYEPGTGLLSRIGDGAVTTSFEYDAFGNKSADIWERDGVQHRRDFSDYHRGKYQFRSDPVDPVAGEVQITRRGINDLGQEVWREDGAGNRTVYESDFAGRPLSLLSPLTAPITLSYVQNSDDDWIEVVYGQGEREMVATLDGFGRTTLLQDYGNGRSGDASRALSWSFDTAGRLGFRSFPYAPGAGATPPGTTYRYDALSRIVEEQLSGESDSRNYCYVESCAVGLLSEFAGPLRNGHVLTDEGGIQTVYAYAAVGDPDSRSLAAITEQISVPGTMNPEFRKTSFRYNAQGDMVRISQADDDGNELARLFDYRDRRLVAEHHPETGTTEHRYDERGNRTFSRTGTEAPVRHRYDGLDRLLALDYPGDKDDIEFSYDSAGRLVSVTNAASARSYHYDSAGRLERETSEFGGQILDIQHRYSAEGYKASVVYPSGMEIDYAPSSLGQATRAGGVITNVSYWPGGQLQSLTYGNSVTGHFELNERQYERSREFARSSGTLLTGLEFAYDPVGNLSAVYDVRFPHRNVQLEYDGISRLVSAAGSWGQEQYRFDAFDNLLERRDNATRINIDYAADKLPASIRIDDSQSELSHDANGSLLNDGTYNYVFNAASQLTGIEQFPGLEYFYDGHGRRIGKVDESGAEYSLYDQSGALLYIDNCERGGQVSEFVYLGTELVGRVDSECAEGCHQ